jgi:hypothetical protein
MTCPIVPHKGLRGGAFQHLQDAIVYGMVLLRIGQIFPTQPVTDHPPTKCNEEIRMRYASGVSQAELARQFGISYQRVHQIVNRRRQ